MALALIYTDQYHYMTTDQSRKFRLKRIIQWTNRTEISLRRLLQRSNSQVYVGNRMQFSSLQIIYLFSKMH